MGDKQLTPQQTKTLDDLLINITPTPSKERNQYMRILGQYLIAGYKIRDFWYKYCDKVNIPYDKRW